MLAVAVSHRRAQSFVGLALLAVTLCCLSGTHAVGAISTIGNVTPAYPGEGIDPWIVSAELVAGNISNGSLVVTGGSQVASVGGTLGSDPGVVGNMLISGADSSWLNSQDLFLGLFGSGYLDVLAGAQVINRNASLGHIDGPGEVLVEGAGSEWHNSEDVFVGNGASGTLTIQQGGRSMSRAAWIGLNEPATGTVVIDGPSSRWEIARTLTLGDVADSGQATLTLTGAGSRLYLGPAAVTQGVLLPVQQTAIVVSDTSGIAALSIYDGNQLHNSGNGYVGVGASESGSVTIDGTGSAWSNDGNVAIGGNGAAMLTLSNGGQMSANAGLDVGTLGVVRGNGTLAANVLNSGAVAPGLSTGNLNITGDYSQAPTGKLQIELLGSAAGQFDTLTCSGVATLGGTLEVALSVNGSDPFIPQLGDTFSFLTAEHEVSGRFTALSLPTLPVGRMWQVRYSADAATLAVTLAGDYDDNNVVDAADYVVWRKIVGAGFDPRADGDTNSIVDADDYTLWRAAFGDSTGSGSVVSFSETDAVVPEPMPSSIIVVAIATILCHPTESGKRHKCRRLS